MAKIYKFNGHVKYLECSQHVFNLHMDNIKSRLGIRRDGKYTDEVSSIPGGYFYKIANTKCKLSYKKGGKWVNLETDIYKEYEDINFIEDDSKIDGGQAYAYFRRFCKIPDVNIPINVLAHYKNKNYDYINIRIPNCIGYDMNADFLAACKDLEIPLELIDHNRALKEHEIGFNSLGIPVYGPSDKICAYVFKSGVHEGMQEWYRRVSELYMNPETKNTKAKPYYQYGIGVIRNHNIALYNTIIHKANTTMESLWDPNTSLWSTTDSIVSLVTRPDLVIGKEPGQFKIEHEGNFVHVGTGYQWNYDLPKNKGLSKSKIENYNKTHDKPYDILNKDKIYIDKIKYKIKDGYIVDEKENKL